MASVHQFMSILFRLSGQAPSAVGDSRPREQRLLTSQGRRPIDGNAGVEILMPTYWVVCRRRAG